MKKIIVCISILTVSLSIFVACSDKSDSEETTATTSLTTVETQRSTIDPNYSMTEAQYTVGVVQTSEKFGDGSEFYINHYDDNGWIAKVDFYKKGKLAYYFIVDATDEMGNCLRSKYYTANGNFVAYFDNTFFFDASGNKITETEFEKRLGI